jgi:hypothetical protein
LSVWVTSVPVWRTISPLAANKIIVAEKTLEKAEKLAKELGSNAQALSVPEAINIIRRWVIDCV